MIWFVPALATVAAELDGFTVEAGRRHTRQGTSNRRVVFERNYLEILWIDDAATVAAHGLGFAARCDQRPGACPFGVVLRGELPAPARADFTRYPLPDAPDLELWLLTAALADPGLPFVAVWPARPDELRGRWPVAWAPPTTMRHPCQAASITAARVTATRVPAIAALAARDVTWVAGPTPALDLTLDALDAPRTLAGPVGLAARFSLAAC